MLNVLGKNTGYSIVEALITMAVFSVIMASVTCFFIIQQKTYQAQGGIVEMQRSSRSAMSFITKELRKATSVNITDTETDQIAFNSIEDNLTRSFSYDEGSDILTFSKGGTPVKYFRNVSNFRIKGDSASASGVKKITITLETRTEDPDLNLNEHHYLTLKSDVTLRNLI